MLNTQTSRLVIHGSPLCTSLLHLVLTFNLSTFSQSLSLLDVSPPSPRTFLFQLSVILCSAVRVQLPCLRWLANWLFMLFIWEAWWHLLKCGIKTMQYGVNCWLSVVLVVVHRHVAVITSNMVHSGAVSKSLPLTAFATGCAHGHMTHVLYGSM